MTLRAPDYSSQSGEIFDAEAIENPQQLYSRLLRESPLSRVADTGVHIVATWALIEEVLKREEDFSANLTGALARGVDGRPTTFDLPNSVATRVIATADEPSHGVHRLLVQSRLAARRISELEAPLREWTGEMIASWLNSGAGEFIQIAEGIPARAVARLLGLPEEDLQQHRRWAMMGGDVLSGDFGEERMQRFALEGLDMATYLHEHFERALADPRDDEEAPLGNILARGVRDGRITSEEAVGIVTVMFGAGGESTAALLGSVVRCLAERPDLVATLRKEPALIPNLVEEVARLEPPFKFHYRVVRRDCELASFELQQGDRLMLLWAAASRDPNEIEDPEELQLTRAYPRHHLSFGRGAHFCIGASLARLEARIVCEELLARTTSLEIAPGSVPVYSPSIFVRRLESLPLAAS